jgi:nitrogenase-associated protein
MVDIVFYEKPGCGGNARQKALLRAAGHVLEVRDLLSWPWTRDSLLEFLAPLPVAEWFNPAAPPVKSGDVRPEVLGPGAALVLLLADPLLIRRPLMSQGDTRMVGFDVARVQAWVGLGPKGPAAGTALEGCAAAPLSAGPCASSSS